AHAGHRAVIHLHAAHRSMLHAHIGHGAHRSRIERWNSGHHSGAWRKGGAGETAAVLRLHEYCESPIFAWLNNDIVGFGGANPKLINRNRAYINTISLHHTHWQIGNAHIENAHRRAVDETQAHAFAGPEQRGPVGCRR